MILPMLRDMRAENATRHSEVITRLEAVAKAQVSFRQALAGDSLMSKLVPGDFEHRIEALEQRVRQLENGS